MNAEAKMDAGEKANKKRLTDILTGNKRLMNAKEKAGDFYKTYKKPVGRFTSKTIFKIFRYLLLICVSYIILSPLIYTFMRSIAVQEEFTSFSFVWVPKRMTFQNYKNVFNSNTYNYFALIKTTLIVVLSTSDRKSVV